MLDVKNISKTFNAGTVNEKVALNGLSLHLNEGDFVTVIGGNGAGKSTLLNAVAGVWPVDSGTIMIDGVDITRLPEHKRAKYIGRVFQDPMMGTAAFNINAPITKITSGILLLSEELSHKAEPQDCIRCGKCVEACPMGLQPYLIGRNVRNEKFSELAACHVLDCIECGCCAYVCPVHLPLLDYCKIAKSELKKK